MNRQHHWFRCFMTRVGLFCAVCFLPSGSRLLGATRDVPLPEALTTIEALEMRVHAASWSVQAISGRVSNPYDPTSLVEVEHRPYGRSKTVVDLVTGRYRIEQEIVTNWAGGPEKHAAMRRVAVFDGKSVKKGEWFKPGLTLPDASAPAIRAEIDVERPAEFMKQYGPSSGLYYFPPNIFGERMSAFLKERQRQGRKVEIAELGSKTWIITTDDYIEVPGVVLRITFDLSKGGIVTDVEWSNARSAEPWRKMHIQVEKKHNGFWVPKTVEDVHLLDKTLTRVTFSDVEVNPNLTDKQFTHSFPKGTSVDDHIERKTYRIGAGIIDEQEAIKTYMEQNSLRFKTPEKRFPWRYVWYTLGGIVLALFSFWLIRRRSRGPKLMIALFALATVRVEARP